MSLNLKFTESQRRSLNAQLYQHVASLWPKPVQACTECKECVRKSARTARPRPVPIPAMNLDSILNTVEILLSDCANMVAVPKTAQVTEQRGASSDPSQGSSSGTKEQSKGAKTPNEEKSVGGALPPPATYAAALLRALNKQKGEQARADKLNRAKMAQVSVKAREDRRSKKEDALRVKYAEGYQPLAERKKASMEKGAKQPTQKPDTSSEMVAKAAHSFVRFSRAQMKGYQAAFLARTGAERWFSAAERAAYKQLSSAEKKKIRVANHEARLKREQEAVRNRQKFRKERSERLKAASERRCGQLLPGGRRCGKECAVQAGRQLYKCVSHEPRPKGNKGKHVHRMVGFVCEGCGRHADEIDTKDG
jgi:DNA polymerase III gamma/tau subunit